MKRSKMELSTDFIFERYNSKYNRLWGQINDCFLLMVQIIIGYIFALMALDSVSIVRWIYSFYFVTIILLFLSIIIGRLELERLKTKAYLNEFIIKNKIKGINY